MCLCLLLAAFVNAGFGESSGTNSEGKARLTRLSLEQLGNTDVTTVSKEPTKLNRTPAAIYVITQEESAAPERQAFLKPCAWHPGLKSRASTPIGGRSACVVSKAIFPGQCSSS